MADNSLPPVPPRRAPLIDIMRELEARPRSRRSQEFDPVAALAAERRSQSRQPLPLPPTPPAASPPPQPGETQAGAGTPPPAPDLSGVYPDIRRRLPENNPYVAAAIRIAEKYDLPPSVFLSLVQRESNFNPRAVSPRGAVGLGQLMPGTAQELGVDPRDPEANLDASARYLKQQITRFGSIPIALAAYNAGPGRVAKSGNQVPNIRETQEYVSDIMRNAGMEGYEGDQRYGFAEGGLADLDEKYAEGGRVGRVAGAVRRAVTRKTPEPTPDLPPVENSRLTQVATTGGTYEKARDVLRERGVEGPVLDYGAGRGHGSAILGGDSFEPYPSAGFRPTYTNSSEIPADRYAGLVNLNVLNVLPPEIRDAAVRDMARVLEPQGTAVITTRGRDVMAARGTPGPEPMSLVIGEGDRARYQKGFTPAELREYLQRILGPRFDVEGLDLGAAGALVRRLYGAAPAALFLQKDESDRGLADLDEKYADGGRVRSPAAAPVASPFDAGYIERLAAQAVGAGEPERDPRDVTLLDRVGRGIGEAYREFVETPERLAQQVYDDAIERGVDPESAARRADRIARRAALTTGAVEMAVPQTPADLALVAAGPLGRVAPAAGRAAAGAAGAMMGMEPSEAEASALRRFIRAYHGSPHRFERFDISKIGTGEGSQAYGRGLYFAEAEPVAFSYRGNPEARYARLSGHMSPREEFAFDMAVQPNTRDWDIIESLVRRYGDTISFDEANQLAKNAIANRGHMYEVQLRTTPQELVNWNAPLVQQPERAIPFLEDILKAPRTGSARVLEREMKPIGEAVDLRTPEVAAQLREVGVPGLRYLDAGSRTGGRGTRNYVMFGDDLIDIVRRYAEGGLATLDEKYAEGGTVRAPKETTIAGQDHRLAYITPEEAALLKARGGSGRMTDYGVRAYDADPGGDAQGSDPGPDGPGPSTDTSTDPGPTTGSPGPRGGMSNEDPEGTPTAANMNTAVAAALDGRGVGIADTAGVSPTGFNAAPGIAEAIGAYSRGEISLAEAIGYGLQSGLAPPGVTPGISVNEIGVQTPAISVDPLGLGLGLVGMAVGVPGLGALGGRVGSAVSQALGVAPSVFSSNPNEGPAASTDMGGGEYLQYGQPQYGTPGLSNIATSMAPATAAPLVDWNQIQREANALNMSVSDYLALKWRSPAAMARGGEVSLQQMLAKYADGGPVASVYDPDEINDLANQILEGADV